MTIHDGRTQEPHQPHKPALTGTDGRDAEPRSSGTGAGPRYDVSELVDPGQAQARDNFKAGR